MRISSVEWFRNNADVFLLLQGRDIFVSTPWIPGGGFHRPDTTLANM
jgi:hypothetical protein